MLRLRVADMLHRNPQSGARFGPAAFYEKAVGAMPIPNSAPGVYAGMLKV
jgi:hypothetical protein